MRRISVLTGAGISAESGIATFRGSGGLWEGYDVREVATPEAWEKDFKKVLEFYNFRRRAVANAQPNTAHIALKLLEQYADVQIVTQNIDDLHERAGSENILHLHGEIRKVRSSVDPEYTLDIGFRDVMEGELCPDGQQLRPHIVWFGEDVPEMPNAAKIVEESDQLVVIGTSLEVYPAAGLLHFAPPHSKIILLDPSEVALPYSLSQRVVHIKSKAGEGANILFKELGYPVPLGL